MRFVGQVHRGASELIALADSSFFWGVGTVRISAVAAVDVAELRRRNLTDRLGATLFVDWKSELSIHLENPKALSLCKCGLCQLSVELTEDYLAAYAWEHAPVVGDDAPPSLRVTLALVDGQTFVSEYMDGRSSVLLSELVPPDFSSTVSIPLEIQPPKRKVIMGHERSAHNLASSIYAQADSRRLWVEAEPEMSMLPSRPARGMSGCQELVSVFAPLPADANHLRRVEAMRRAVKDIELGKLNQLAYLVREMCTQFYLPKLQIPFGTDLVHYVISVPSGVVDAYGNIIVQSPFRILYEAVHHRALHAMATPEARTRVPHWKMVANLGLGQWASHWAHWAHLSTIRDSEHDQVSAVLAAASRGPSHHGRSGLGNDRRDLWSPRHFKSAHRPSGCAERTVLCIS